MPEFLVVFAHIWDVSQRQVHNDNNNRKNNNFPLHAFTIYTRHDCVSSGDLRHHHTYPALYLAAVVLCRPMTIRGGGISHKNLLP